jgi:hypothetical protein
MGSTVMDILANQPLREQQQQNQNQMTQAQIPLVNAQAQQAQQQAAKVQQQMKDNAALTQAWTQSNGDWDAAMKMAKQNGLSFEGYVGAMNDHLGVQQKFYQNTKEQNEAMAPMLAQHGQLMESVQQAGPEGSPERAQAAQQVGPQLGIDPAKLLKDSDIGIQLANNNYLSKSVEDAQKRQQTATEATVGAKNTAEAGKAQADTAKTNAEVPGVQAQGQMTQAAADAQMLAQAAKQGPQALQAALDGMPHGRAKLFEGLTNPSDIMKAGLTPEQSATTSFNQAKLTFDQNAKSFDEKLAASKNAREQQQFNMTYGQGLNEFGQPLAPGQQPQNPLAHSIATYMMPPPATRSMQTPMGQMLLRQVLAENPDFDATQFPNRNKTRQAFTTGSQGQQINAMNTAIGHLDQLGDAVGALGNGDVQIANKAKNWLSTQLGSPNVTNFDTLKTALSGELASVLKKSGATDAEIKSVESTISSKNSPEQLAGYVKTQIPIMGSKLNALNYQYHQAMGEKDPFQALSPEAKGVLQKNGFDPNNPRVQGAGNQGGGGGKSFKAGDTRVINGQTVTRGADGVWR